MNQDRYHHPLDTHLLLLRFPDEARQELAALESPPPKRPARWPRRIAALSVTTFLLALALVLEIDAAQQRWFHQALQSGLHTADLWKERIRSLPPPQTRPQYSLEQNLLGLQQLSSLHLQLCTPSPTASLPSAPNSAPTTSLSTQSPSSPSLSTTDAQRPYVLSGQGLPTWLQQRLPAHLIAPLAATPRYLPSILKRSWRRWRLSAPPPTQTRLQWCQQDFPIQQKQLEQHISLAQKTLLQKAKNALQDYAWCQQIWARTYYTRPHRTALDQLHRSGCLERCQDPQDDLCTTCLRSLSIPSPSPSSTTPQPPQSPISPSPEPPTSPSPEPPTSPSPTSSISQPPTWPRYLRLLQQAQKHQCIQANGKSAQDGVFHLGWYYLHVKQVLDAIGKMEQWGRCDSHCQTTRTRWGFRLQLTTSPRPAQVYLQLWPQRTTAPPPLQALLDQPQATTNTSPLWLPAMRFDLLGPQKPDAFYFMRLFDPQTTQQSALLLAPTPNTLVQHTLPLLPLQLHNDGRQIVRFPSISPDGHFLSFATFRQLPGEPAILFPSPLCPQRAPSKQTTPWHSVLSLYRLSKQGIPTDQAQHKATIGHIHHLQITQSERHYALRLTTHGNLGKEPNPIDPERPYTLWEIPLEIEQSQPFGAPTRATAGQPHPFFSLTNEGDALLALRLGCTTPPQQIQLEQQPRPRWSGPQPLPENKLLLHGAWYKPQRLALLLQDQQAPRATSLWFPLLQGDGTTDTPPSITLPHAFTQITAATHGLFLSGGPWGTPLQQIRWTQQQTTTLLPSHPNARYLDPILHPQSQRLFVIQQWKLPLPQRFAYLFFSLPLEKTP